MKTLQLLICASEIPLGSTVTKRTGEKLYTLRDRIKVWPANDGESKNTPVPEPNEIKAIGEARFLVAENGDASVVDGSTLLRWKVEDDDLLAWLQERGMS